MTTLRDNCSVYVLRLHRWKPNNDNTDKQLLGGCTKTTPPETFNDKTEGQFHGDFTMPTSPLEPLNDKTDIQIHGGCNKTTPLELTQ